jgi:ABC-2 type transport system permease protein
MPSKTSLLNKELILQIVRSTGWISLLYFLGLFFTLPLAMIMRYSDERNRIHYTQVNSLFDFTFDIQITLLLIIPVLLAVFLFRFLQVKQSADLMHSIPMKREKMFHHYALSGMVSLIFPVLLIALIIFFVHNSLDLGEFFRFIDILKWVGTMVVLNLLLFMAGTFVATVTGISAVQGVLTYILLIFPVGITLLTLSNLSYFLFGFPSSYFINKNLDTLSPLTYAGVLDGRPLQNEDIILYIVITILLYGLSLLLYKKRKIESASEAIAFPKLRNIFKYGVTFCSMLLGGMYFGEFQSNSLGWMIFGYAVGSIFGYYIGEMVLQKNWRVFGHYKGLVIYALIVSVLVLGIETLGFYENKVPDQSEIKSVLLADSSYVYTNQESFDHVFVPGALKEQENIEAVRKLHQQIINDKDNPVELTENDYMIPAFFLYELNNGNKVIRQYEVHEKIYEDFYKQIYDSEEYKRATNEIFHLNIDEINQLTIHGNGPGKTHITFNDREELQELIKVIQSDILAESYQDRTYFGGRGSTIEIHMEKDHFVHLDFKPTYKGLTKWLETHELLDQAMVIPEDVSRVLIAEWKEEEHAYDSPEHYPEQVAEEMETRSDVLNVTETDQIGEILNKAGWGRTHKYMVVFHYKHDNTREILYLDEEHTPEFVKNHFN